MTHDASKACLNCGTPLTGEYCSACGQRDIEPGIRFKEVVSDFFSFNFSIEGPIWQTIRLLVVNPGLLFRDFIAGKRKSYYKPIQFFIVTTLVYFVLGKLIHFDPLAGQFEERPAQMEEFMGTVEQAVRFMVSNLNNFLFLLVLGVALVLKLSHRKRYSLIEYLTIGFYITGFYILIGTVDLFAWLVGLSLKSLKIFFFFLYFSYAYASLVQSKRVVTYLVGLLLSLPAFLFYFLTAFGLSLAWVILG